MNPSLRPLRRRLVDVASRSWTLRTAISRLLTVRDALRTGMSVFEAPEALADPYRAWCRLHEGRDTPPDAVRLDGLRSRPLISVIMPVYNTAPRWLERAIRSVELQSYPHWELCIADDASDRADTRRVLEIAVSRDPRIRVVERSMRGNIAAASNSALSLARGEFVALLDHDDELAPSALLEVASVLDPHPDADIIFSDEDKIDAKGRRFDPYFKSGWNPDLLLSQNAVSHLGVYRRDLVRRIGGFRDGFENSWDYDLVLRAAEATAPQRIHHIPKILYHWRAIDGSTAAGAATKPHAWEAGARAIAEALRRRGESGKVASAVNGTFYRVRRDLPDPAPAVTVIVPTRDRPDLLRDCIDGILTRTDYPPVELIVVDHDSRDPGAVALLDELRAKPRVTVMKVTGPFNFSAMNNQAVGIATGDILVFMNNDVRVERDDWLRELVSHAVRPEVGATGCRLLYPDGRIQHAGIVLGMGGVAGHVHRLLGRRDAGYFGRAALVQDVSAVTAACMAVRRQVFAEVGGFDAENLPVAFNDVDFCLRVRERGYRIVWTPHAELYHLESVTRGDDLTGQRFARFQRESAYMRRRWGEELDNDFFYNPNLSLDQTAPAPAFPPRPPLPRAGR